MPSLKKNTVKKTGYRERSPTHIYTTSFLQLKIIEKHEQIGVITLNPSKINYIATTWEKKTILAQ